MLRRMARKGGRRILLGWNRGLGDIPLGLYAMVERIRERVSDAEITFVTRDNLVEGFSLLERVKVIGVPDWKRGEPYSIDPALKRQFDLVIEWPRPTDWVSWQLSKVVPRLKWDPKNDSLYEKFGLSDKEVYVGVQVVTETQHGPWRNWPLERWEELFDRLEKMGVKVILFGYGDQPQFQRKNIVDLRGKTTLLELLSILQFRVSALVLPDSGIASIAYYLDVSFPIQMVTLWADPQGILKQDVHSPNPQLIHTPLIASQRDLSLIKVGDVMRQLASLKTTGAIILAGGQGTRLGCEGPKGLYSIEGKTLFEWICEKAPKHSSIAIMTSPLNHKETVAYFEKNHFFGLDISFFQQEMDPLLDEAKTPLDLLAPNGNGSVFRSFVKAGLAERFAKKGIDVVTVTNVDNPLSDPFDAELIASLRLKKADVVAQCIEKEEADQKMGAFIEKEGKVIEYTELDPSVQYRYAYSGQLGFSLPFFCQMAEVDLPIHWVEKNVSGKKVWKGEKFIFDVFPHAKRVKPFCVPKETHYAPVKGPESLGKVQQLLRERR